MPCVHSCSCSAAVPSFRGRHRVGIVTFGDVRVRVHVRPKQSGADYSYRVLAAVEHARRDGSGGELSRRNGMEWNGMEWNGMEWNGMEWNGMEWNGMEWIQSTAHSS
jgi:hypothetical protein